VVGVWWSVGLGWAAQSQGSGEGVVLREEAGGGPGCGGPIKGADMLLSARTEYLRPRTRVAHGP
jgi:hypothetical protein